MKTVLETLNNLEKCKEFYEWLYTLSGEPQDERAKAEVKNQVDNIHELGIGGFCEDVALFFYCSFEDVDIVETENHFCFKYGDKFYDAYNRDGVEKVEDLEYFKRNPEDSTTILDFKTHELLALPAYYFDSAFKCKMAYRDRICNHNC